MRRAGTSAVERAATLARLGVNAAVAVHRVLIVELLIAEMVLVGGGGFGVKVGATTDTVATHVVGVDIVVCTSVVVVVGSGDSGGRGRSIEVTKKT